MEKVIIFGNKSIAREAFYYLKYYSEVDVVGFTVDREYMESDTFCNLPIVPFDIVTTAFQPGKFNMLIAVGYVKNNKIREERYFQSKKMGYQLINFLSPKSILHPETSIGDNCIIGHYTVISPDAKIGNNVIIASGCMIGHDVNIGDHCFFSPGVVVAGSVNISSNSYLGANATIRNRISIGKECVIGAGAILLENAEDRSVYLGEPATLLPISSNKLPLG